MLDNIDLTKAQLRQKIKQIRSQITAEMCRQASLAICQHIQGWQIFQASTITLAYMPMRSEVDLTPLFSQCPQKKWVIPRVCSEGQMVFHTYNHSRLVLHPYGMLEPDPCSPIILPEMIQLVLVPGLAFDLDGWRLGYGGGFYDRFLTKYKGNFSGITYKACFLKNLPHAMHDIPMQFVIHENGIFKTHNQKK